jgi:hypothetical protein
LGRFLRDDIAGIIHPGKVGLFGGHREGDEAYLECIVREIYEEVSDFVPAERFEYLASLDGTDTDVDGENVRGQFFIARDAGSPRLAAKQVSHGDIQPVRVDRGDDRCGYFVQRSGVPWPPAFVSPSRVDSHYSKWFPCPRPLAGIQIQPIIATSIALR